MRTISMRINSAPVQFGLNNHTKRNALPVALAAVAAFIAPVAKAQDAPPDADNIQVERVAGAQEAMSVCTNHGGTIIEKNNKPDVSADGKTDFLICKPP